MLIKLCASDSLPNVSYAPIQHETDTFGWSTQWGVNNSVRQSLLLLDEP